jgi:Zn-finger nucleic acid-binding protein
LPLATVEVEGVELDFCVESHGYWLDEGELEVLLVSTTAVLGAEVEGTPGKRRCPRCRRVMLMHGAFDSLELDLCPRGDGVWFDEGELDVLLTELARAGRLADDTPLARSLHTLTRRFGATP